MNAMDWSEFAGLAAAGALGLFCLFEGTRRLAGGNAEANGGRRFMIGLLIVGLLAGYAYWQHWTYAQVARAYRGAEAPRELPEDWGKKMTPAKRAAASQEAARGAYVTSGVIRQFFDVSGQRKVFAPAQDDVKRRENVVAVIARLENRADEQFKTFVFWLVLGASALVFSLGFAMAPAATTGAEAEERAEPTLAMAPPPRPAPPAKPAVGEDTVPLPNPKTVGEDTIPLPKPAPGAVPPKKA